MQLRQYNISLLKLPAIRGVFYVITQMDYLRVSLLLALIFPLSAQDTIVGNKIGIDRLKSFLAEQ